MNERDAVSNEQMPDWLLEWIDQVPKGVALDVGAGEGRIARWLVQRGFKLNALEPDPEQADVLRGLALPDRMEVIEADVRTADLAPGGYSLIVAAAVLHFVPPRSLPTVAHKLVGALQPGGFLMAEVFTADDPSCQWRIDQGVDPVAENTFPLMNRPGVIHYFGQRELRKLFADLDIEEYEESRRAADQGDWGYRAGAHLIGRRPARR